MCQLQLFAAEQAAPDRAHVNDQVEALLNSDCPILLCFSGGKDSLACLLHLLEMGVDRNRIILHHHDVDGGGPAYFDWPCTTSYCQSVAEAFGLDLLFSYRRGGIRREMYRTDEVTQPVLYQDTPGGEFILLPSLDQERYRSTRRKFPAIAADLRTRWCSSSAKIDVFSRVVSAQYPEGDLLVITGERRQESGARAKYLESEPHRSHTKKRHAIHWRPVIDYTETQVWELIERWKVQAHPAYELGWSRCSCMICIFSSPTTWASINELAPERIENIDQDERILGHTLHRKGSIFSVFKGAHAFIPEEARSRWAEEALGEFRSPVFIDPWTLPAGAYSKEGAGSI